MTKLEEFKAWLAPKALGVFVWAKDLSEAEYHRIVVLGDQ